VTATPTGTATSSAAGAALPQALLGKAGSGVKAATSTSTAKPTATATPTATPTASGATTPTAAPTDASDPNWVTPAIAAQFAAETCQNTESLQGNTDDPNKPFVTCSSDKLTKFVLGPVEVFGTDIKSAQAGLVPGANGIATTNWQVELTFNGAGTSKFAKVTERLVGLASDPPRDQFAVVVDGLVISDPQVQQAIVGGDAQITSPTFTQSSATALAEQLKYGALPISFNVLTENQISPTLGAQSLQKSLIAGLIGLILVVLYALLQYRLLGLVTVASLSLSALLTYGTVVYLGWAQGFRLSLAGVTGLIVSIGITADSFIVFFERVRDEVREGRALRSAVETGWARGRRTILAADSVSFLAAVVLYILAAGSVQGFAFTLGLTTIIDVIIVFLFTQPMLQLLARTEFFGGGHKWSGLDPNRLGTNARRKRPAVGVPVAAGAGGGGGAATVAAPRAAMTIAERRAAAERAARDEQSGDQGEDA
jgi:preprotein translocase subunit SecD